MSQKQENKPPEIVFILLAIGMVVGLAICITGFIVIISKGKVDAIDFFKMLGGWIVSAVSAFIFGKLLLNWHGINYFKVVKDMLFFRDPRKHSLKKQDN